MQIKKIFDYTIIEVFNKTVNLADKRGISFYTSGIAAIISLLFWLNIFTIELFLRSRFTIPFLEKTWPDLVVLLLIFFLISEYTYRVVTKENTKNVKCPKYAVEVVLTFVILTIMFNFYAIIYFKPKVIF